MIDEDGSIVEDEASDDAPEPVCYGAKPSIQPESFDLSELKEIRFDGAFTESYPDDAQVATEPDFGMIHPDEIPFEI